MFHKNKHMTTQWVFEEVKTITERNIRLLKDKFGGLSEQLSLVLGFNGLIPVAIGYYLLSLVGAPMGRRGMSSRIPS